MALPGTEGLHAGLETSMQLLTLQHGSSSFPLKLCGTYPTSGYPPLNTVIIICCFGRAVVTNQEPNPAREQHFCEICLNLRDAMGRKWVTQRKSVHLQICLLILSRLTPVTGRITSFWQSQIVLLPIRLLKFLPCIGTALPPHSKGPVPDTLNTRGHYATKNLR